MSKVRVAFASMQGSYRITGSAVSTGWKPGQIAIYETTQAEFVKVNNATGSHPAGYFIDDDTELTTTPHGSHVTLAQGPCKLFINHATEVAASDATRVYAANVESASTGAALYSDVTGKWTALCVNPDAHPQLGTLCQVPTAANNYELGVITIR